MPQGKYRKPVPDHVHKDIACLLAMGIRNALEDFHAEGKLQDDDMREFNTIVRNSICTSLFCISNYDRRASAKAYIDLQRTLIPDYWEEPQLTDEFLETDKIVFKRDIGKT